MISAVVLAAGASTRMGPQKLLLPLGGEPLVRRTVRQVCDAGFDDVLVVLGSEHEAVLAALDGLPVRHAVNPQFATGMGSSFRTAVEHLADSDAAMFALADQPFVTTSEYRAVLDTFRQDAPPIVSVRYGEVMAPPHLFEREFFPELAALEHGARSVLLRHVERTTVLHFPADLLMDIDTPEDYELAMSRRVFGAVKAADRAAEEPALEAAPNRQDFAQDRDGHLLRASRHPAPVPRGCARGRASRHPARSPAPPARRAASRSASAARARRCRRHPIRGEAQALLIAFDVMVHHEHEGAGACLHAVGELAEMRAHQRGAGKTVRRQERLADVDDRHREPERPGQLRDR